MNRMVYPSSKPVTSLSFSRALPSVPTASITGTSYPHPASSSYFCACDRWTLPLLSLSSLSLRPLMASISSPLHLLLNSASLNPLPILWLLYLLLFTLILFTIFVFILPRLCLEPSLVAISPTLAPFPCPACLLYALLVTHLPTWPSTIDIDISTSVSAPCV